MKGILGGHGPLAHFLNWHVRTFGLTADDRFSMISGLSHDPLLRDVFTPIQLGASLHIPDPDDILAPGRLREWMASEGITVAHLTPAVARVLAEDSTGGELKQLRYVFLGGDVLTRDEVRGLRRVAPAASIVNFYGATETPQAMGWYLVPEESEKAPLPLQMPLGRGIDDVQLLVLGKGLGLAGIGEVGEIAVRTPHLARGYLGDEALTRERFVTSPFSGHPEDRLYRTGDLARYRPDGSVEFAGRADTQVKVRGFRVELGEIEAALREYPGIEGAVVLAQDVPGGDRRLVAYLSHGAQGQPNATALRNHLKGLLPVHMVPSSFAFLDRLPLTPSGKLDRKALMQLDAGPASGAREIVPPRTQAELFIAALWRDLLGIEGVSVYDNFFDLGGHSLLSMRLLAAIEKETGHRLHPRAITFQTLEQIAVSCEGAPGLSAPASEPRGITGRLFGALRKLVSGARSPQDEA